MDKIITLCGKFNLNIDENIDDLLHKDIREIKGEEESKNKLNKYMDDFLKYITDTINLFSNMNFKSKLRCLFEQIIIILICLSFIITNLGNELFLHLFAFLPDNVNHIINNILQFILVSFCILLSIIIIIHIFKTRYLNYYDNLKKEVNNDNNNEKINIDKKNKILFKTNESKIIIRDPKHTEYRFISGLLKLVMGTVKIFLLFVSLFPCIILALLFASFIISFTIYKTGCLFIGLLISILSSSIITIILILIIFNFVFNRKNNKKKMIYSFIISLIVLGIGIGLSFIGAVNFEVIENDDTMLKTEIKEYEMKDDLLIDIFSNTTINYIESDINNIKMQYKLNKYCTVEDEKYNNHIRAWATCSNNPKRIKEFINNFNDKKIITIDEYISSITIYASKENFEKIKNNYKKYIDNQTTYNNTIHDYEQTIHNLEGQIENYKRQIAELEESIQNKEQ